MAAYVRHSRPFGCDCDFAIIIITAPIYCNDGTAAQCHCATVPNNKLLQYIVFEYIRIYLYPNIFFPTTGTVYCCTAYTIYSTAKVKATNIECKDCSLNIYVFSELNIANQQSRYREALQKDKRYVSQECMLLYNCMSAKRTSCADCTWKHGNSQTLLSIRAAVSISICIWM